MSERSAEVPGSREGDATQPSWAEFERSFRQVLEAAPDAMIVSDPTGRIRLVNHMAERMFGHSRAELVGETIEVLVPKRYRFNHIRHRELYERAPQPRYMGEGRELFAVRKDGSEFPVEISLIPMASGPEQVVCAAVRDITDRARARAALESHTRELERSNAELEQFAYVASHDLQEPLRMVASYAQLLARRYKDQLDDDAQEFIDYVVDGATRMQALINDLLAYSRVGTRAKPFAETDCNAVLRQALRSLEATIEEQGGEVSADELPTVTADAAQLTQVFQNLIANGLKFHGEEPPRIHVGVTEQDDEAVFSVRDNGIGIDPQYAGRIFLLFQRLHTKREYPGTGIGLAICKKIIERHGGRMWVESEPGKGSTFFFSLPLNPTIPIDRGLNQDGIG